MTTMQIDRAVVQQALEALYEADTFHRNLPDQRARRLAAMAALRAALAQQSEPVGTRALIEECLAAFAEELAAWDIDPPLHHVKQAHDKCEAWLAALAQQAEPVEPVAEVFVRRDGVSFAFWLKAPPPERTKLYTAPPQRKPLTDEEIESCRQQGYAHAGLSAPFDFGKAARAIERKVKGDEA